MTHTDCHEHTPGPWASNYGIVAPASDYRGAAGIVYPPSEIARIGSRPDPDETDANTALITAAPDLLAAARAVLESGYSTDAKLRALDALIAAVAKAERRPA
jgi:hypothetical protein